MTMVNSGLKGLRVERQCKCENMEDLSAKAEEKMPFKCK